MTRLCYKVCVCVCVYVCTYTYVGKKSLDEGAGDKKAKPAKQGSLDSNNSNNSSGDERKHSSSDDTEETLSDDATKKKVCIPLTYSTSIKNCI